MTDDLSSKFGTRVHAVLYDMDGHLTPDNRASIRSAARELPLDAWIALAAAPAAELDQPETRQVWETVVRASVWCGRVVPGSARFSLKRIIPEARVSVAACGSRQNNLIALIAEAVRWLVSHEVERCTLTDLVVLGIADARGDSAHVRKLWRELL